MNKVILWLFVLTAACFSMSLADEIQNDSGMKDLASLEILKQDFNVHQDKIRIVTLLSPT